MFWLMQVIQVDTGVWCGCRCLVWMCMRSSACLLVVPRARANVYIIGDVEELAAEFVVPRAGPVQPRGHKSRGAMLASNTPDGRVALLAARTVEKGGGQEREVDDAEVRVSGCELLGRLSTCLQQAIWGCG